MIVTPNQVSFARVLATPFIFALIVYPIEGMSVLFQAYLTGILFAIVGFSDFLDGYLARKYNKQSVLGEVLDPLADKMLVTAALVALLSVDKFSAWAVFLILSREFLVTGVRVVIARGQVSVKSSWSGKVKTVVQMLAIGFSIVGWMGADILVVVAVLITLYSGFEYVFAARKFFVSAK